MHSHWALVLIRLGLPQSRTRRPPWRPQAPANGQRVAQSLVPLLCFHWGRNSLKRWYQISIYIELVVFWVVFFLLCCFPCFSCTLEPNISHPQSTHRTLYDTTASWLYLYIFTSMLSVSTYSCTGRNWVKSFVICLWETEIYPNMRIEVRICVAGLLKYRLRLDAPIYQQKEF